jgi:hypothetical protein
MTLCSAARCSLMQPGVSCYVIGMAGCSLVWPGSHQVWTGVAECGLAWPRVDGCGMVQLGVARFSQVQLSPAQYNQEQLGVTRCSHVQPGVARSSPIQLGVDGSDLVSPHAPSPYCLEKRMGDKWTDERPCVMWWVSFCSLGQMPHLPPHNSSSTEMGHREHMTTIAEVAISDIPSVKFFFFISNFSQYMHSFSSRSKLGYQKSLEARLELLMRW